MEERGITRRTTLGWLGALAVGAAATGCSGADAADSPAAAGDYSLTDWVADRGDSYLVGHRGAGDVFPEHSMESYQAAVDWGAKAMEISVGITSDNVLVCMHDLTLQRTTNLTGNLRNTSYADLQKGWIEVPRLGPYWQQTKTQVPLFEDVLRRFGGRVILCVEAKDDKANAPMMSMIAKYALETSVMVKTYFKSKRIAEAKKLGLGVFAYFTTPAELTDDTVQVLASQLSPRSDAIVVPNSGPGGYLANDLVEVAVATGIPIRPYPLHRRSDVTFYNALGMAGAVTSNIGYLNSRTEVAVTDQWARGTVVPGELTRDPYDDVPRDPAGGRRARALLTPGRQASGNKLATTATAPPVRGEWMRFRLEVTPTQLTWIRQDQPARVTATDKSFRGGYLHIGRSSSDGSLSFRRLRVTRSS